MALCHEKQDDLEKGLKSLNDVDIKDISGEFENNGDTSEKLESRSRDVENENDLVLVNNNSFTADMNEIHADVQIVNSNNKNDKFCEVDRNRNIINSESGLDSNNADKTEKYETGPCCTSVHLSTERQLLALLGIKNDQELVRVHRILCSERVTQMTRTYNDIEAVNRLLEEKERDLELAAKIGQTLLTKNQEVSEKNEELEDQLAAVTEKVNQLKHEIVMKDGLLQAFTDNVDLSPSDESSIDSVDGLHATGASALRKKVKDLEDENIKLRLETDQLSAETSDYEEKEQKLVDDCLSQLGSIKGELEFYSEELAKKTEECSHQKEEVTNLLAQVVGLQKKVKIITAENMELQMHLQASQESQRKLTKELSELKDKQDELAALYEEAQEEIRVLRRKQKPGAVRHSYMSSSMISIPTDSLASELESSLKGDIEYPRGYSPSERKVHNWKVFETAKAVKKSGSCRNSLAGSRSSLQSASSSLMHLPLPSNNSSHNTSRNDSGGESAPMSNRSSMYFSDVESVQSDAQSEGYYADLDSLYGTSQIGRPGIPGSNDLETALRKLSLRRANELNEMDYKEEEEKRRHRHNESESDVGDTPGNCRTPDSTLSTGSGLSQFSLTGSNNPYYRLPQKLRIVKPLEGSVTLRQWQQLATPNIEGVFETRPGVQTKGDRKLDTEVETYNISDIEEDDDYTEIPGKRYEHSYTINTFTNSMVRHPSQNVSDDEDDLDSQFDMSDSSSTPQMSTPRMATSVQRSNQATSTYSMSLGLAAILNERDVGSSNEQKSDRPKPLNPTRVSSIVSDSHFSISKNKLPTVYATTSSTEVKMATVLPQVRADNNSEQSEKNQGPSILIDKLKNTGVSLYGYLGNWGKSANTPNAGPGSTQEASGQSPKNVEVTGNVTAYSASETSNSGKSTVSGILGRASTGGVLGALTSLRQNGLL